MQVCLLGCLDRNKAVACELGVKSLVAMTMVVIINIDILTLTINEKQC